MKKFFGRMIVVIIAISMLGGVFCYAGEENVLTSFSDIGETYAWAHDTIMKMTKAGLFKGTTEPVNGVGTFSPGTKMTRAEFITTVLRALDLEATKKITLDPECWWKEYYELALEKKLLLSFELDRGDLSQPMSREEMAMVMVRFAEIMGEKLDKRVEKSRIPDFDTVNVYYRDYVVDCFSLGLICGKDDSGTFAPKDTLIRAEAATVLCRLVDKEERLDVIFPADGVGEGANTVGNGANGNNGTSQNNQGNINNNGNANNNYQTNTDYKDPTIHIPTDPEKEEDPDLMPWEKEGAKQPKDYSYEEFANLSQEQKEAFENTFGSYEKFFEWLENAHNEAMDIDNAPWKKAGEKQPSEYSYKEYMDLSEAHKIAFRNTFASSAEYEAWLEKALKQSIVIPWENGGVHPSKYDYKMYKALSPELQIAFQNYLGKEEFDKWLRNELKDDTVNIVIPWENGGLAPSEYTYAKYEALSPELKIAFQNYLGKEGFDEWLNRALGNDSGDAEIAPWENGGIHPSLYTYQEYEALSPELKVAFQNYLGKAEFDKWLNGALGNDSGDAEIAPWENGGIHPSLYTYQEYEALSPELKIAFQNYLGKAEFDKWLNGALGNTEEIAPWENGGLHPSLYTYQDYLRLSPGLKIKFQDYLGPVEFDKWLNRVLGNTEEIAPWENGGLHPSLYTYQDYLQLSPGLKIKFQDYLGPVEFDKWLQKVNPKG